MTSTLIRLGRLGTPPRMRRWRAALAGRLLAPADVVCIGDSITEGTGASARANRWLDLLAAGLRTAYPTPGAPGGGYLPALTLADYPPGWTYGGNVGSNGTFGLGRRSAVLRSPDGFAARTVTGTSVTVAWTAGPGLGTMRVLIDGSAVATIDTAAAGGATGGGRRSFAFSSRGTRTVRLEWASGGEVYLSGLFVRDGDENRGVRVTDSGQHGSSSGDWSRLTTPGTAYLLGQELAAVAPALVVLGLGANDMIQDRAPAAHLADMRDIVAQIRGATTSPPDILLHAPYQLAADHAHPWSAYVANLARIADDTPQCWLLDLSARLPRAGSDTYGLIAADGIHPNDAGHRAYAVRVREQITDPTEPRTDVASIRAALDYDDAAAPADGQAIVWSASAARFVPRPVVLPAHRGPIGGTSSTSLNAITVSLDPNGAPTRRITLTGDVNINPPAPGINSADGTLIRLWLMGSGMTRLFMFGPGFEVSPMVPSRTIVVPLDTWRLIEIESRGGTWRLVGTDQALFSPAAIGAAPARPTVRTVTASTTAAVDDLLLVDASEGPITITPPANPAPGDSVELLRIDAGTATVRWAGAVHSDTDATVVARWTGARLTWSGTVWVLTATNQANSGIDEVARTALFGGPGRTRGYLCSVIRTVDFAYPANGGDVFASGDNWSADSDDDGLYTGGQTANYITIPISDRYDVRLHNQGTASSGAGMFACAVTLDAPDVQRSILRDVRYAISNAEITCHDTLPGIFLPAGSRLYWSTWGSVAHRIHARSFGVRTMIAVETAAK